MRETVTKEPTIKRELRAQTQEKLISTG